MTLASLVSCLAMWLHIHIEDVVSRLKAIDDIFLFLVCQYAVLILTVLLFAIHMELLTFSLLQIVHLKYFYAVIVCDTRVMSGSAACSL